MKKIKKFTIMFTLVFTFFFSMLNVNAGVKSIGENLEKGSTSSTTIRYLFVYKYDLSPKFDPNIYEYDIIAPPGTNKIKLTYRAASQFSKVDVDMPENLTNGSIIIARCTAQDGSIKEYKFTLRYSNSKLLYTILIIFIILILIASITSLVLYILWKKGIIKITKKHKEKIGEENYVN